MSSDHLDRGAGYTTGNNPRTKDYVGVRQGTSLWTATQRDARLYTIFSLPSSRTQIEHFIQDLCYIVRTELSAFGLHQFYLYVGSFSKTWFSF